MFLRSLELRGFKSFADRTTLEFAQGTSVIVGPNGSGKSNLVDAISWVLGEQGPRALRGAQMADVVFAGSPKRPALGMAQVSLVIDNSAGLIPVEASEIEVARAVYRSGESQYLIGGEPCRLMDIQELLSDTGIGRGLHTVVGQGNLEEVLVARPEERRLFIEEAAGIAKHRRRKERAQRKLASMEQDLLRLQDVMTELRRQLRPLKQQAEAASRHEKYTAEAATLAAKLAAARLRSLYAERDRRRPSWEEGQARRQEAEGTMAELDARIAALDERLAAAERALTQAEEKEAAAVGARSDAEARLRELVGSEADARQRAAAEAGMSGRLFALDEDTRRTEAQLADTVAALEAREAELAAAEEEHSEAVRVRREAEESRTHAREMAVARRAELQTLRRSLELSGAERERLAGALADVTAREGATQAERDRLEREVERLDAEETPQADRQIQLGKEEDALSQQLTELEERERGLEARRHVLDARRRALSETPGRRFLSMKPPRAIGLLAELISVDRGMEKAVAAALGPLADAVVYESHDDAVGDAAEAGGAALAVGERDTGTFVLPGERSLLSSVRPDPRARRAVVAVLRHVYVAGDGDEALAKHRRHPAASFVTRDGVLVGPSVVRTAPTPRQEEIDARRQDIVIQRDLSAVRKDLREIRERLVRVRTERSAVNEALRRADSLITAAADRMARMDADLAALRRERSVVEERLAGVDQAVASARSSLDDVPDEPAEPGELPPVSEPPLGLRVEVEALRRDRRRLAQSLAGVRSEAERLRREDPERLAEEVERLAAERAAAEEALREAEAAAREATSSREAAAGEAMEARALEAEANRAWRGTAAKLQALRDQYEDEEQARRDVERRIEEAERILRQGHSTEPEAALGLLGDDDSVDSLQRRSDLVARRLALLGRVNLVAAEEYRSLEERHAFLEREIADVRTARRDLQEVVREVDRKMEEIWSAAYHDVAEEFSALFGELFPGGEGKLGLTEPDDMLATGIDIEARPGRKRVKRLSLLSGGERALTALAFLFAIFRARPSPFYLLDEVEAALDDINLHRFLDLVKGFARTSQVLLVTHQKRTMEAADVLYGVSMGQDGASAVIAQRVEEAVEAAPAT